MDVATFFGNVLGTMYPDSFVLALMAVLAVVITLIYIRSPAPFTVMAAFVVFAIVAGGGMFEGITSSVSTVFTPFLLLAIVIIGGGLAYAFWRLFGN